MNCVDTSILKGNFEMFFIRHLCHLYICIIFLEAVDTYFGADSIQMNVMHSY
jgi:hypothetical protein